MSTDSATSALRSAIVTRQPLYIRPDPARVILRPFKPAAEPREFNPTDKTRANHIVNRVLELDVDAAAQQLAELLENFQGRHRDFSLTLEARAAQMDPAFLAHSAFNKAQRQLIGACFLHEYSFEAVALFNPSIVAHPDQSDLPTGACRFILSLRAVGEGHVSSLTFRTGVVAADGTVTIHSPARLAALPRTTERHSTGVASDSVDLAFDAELDISERVIFPATEAQSNGIEDARFVAFEAEGEITFYATYTAYSGRAIRSELIETADFVSFRMTPLKGPAARNKGMALFPRKINGRYAMIGRQDNENLYLIYSDDLYSWGEGTVVLKPGFPWEFVQIGNCGSPIELEQGWLLLTHGVGPLRRYTIGAILLDKADPSRVLAHSFEPLLRPQASERDGYVPNVVYTCGGLRHDGRIILPYAVSDTFTTFATIEISALMRSFR